MSGAAAAVLAGVVAVLGACEREPRSATPAFPAPALHADAAPSIFDDTPKPLANAGPTQAPAELFGRACARGREEAPPSLPFPVGIPAGSYLASWCRDGDAFFHPNGARAADGALAGRRPDGAWTYYRESGERLLSGRYVDGVPDGLWRVYDARGAVTQLGCFRAGEKRWGVTGDKPPGPCP